MDNYICINGKKSELTEEQMRALGIELFKATPFERAEERKMYYVIGIRDKVDWFYESGDRFDEECFNVGNYCTDKAIMEQRALHETLNRLLWRYSMKHDGEGNYTIAYNTERDEFFAQNAYYKYFEPTFKTFKIAENAITEIIEPFMKAHPEFKW